MNSKEKFVNYLKNEEMSTLLKFSKYSQKTPDEIIEAIPEETLKELSNIKNIIAAVSSSDKEFRENGRFNTEYNDICKYLKSANMNMNECMKILFDVIDKNLRLVVLDEKSNSIIESKVNAILPVIKKLWSKSKIYSKSDFDDALSLLSIDDSVLSKEEKFKKEVVKALVSNCVMTPDDLEYKSYMNLKEHYFDKSEYDLESIEIVYSSLLALKVDNDIALFIKSKLMKKIKKEDIKINFNYEPVKSEIITDKEYKQIKKEILKYYDLKTNLEKQELDSALKDYVASLIVKLGLDNNEIINIFRRLYDCNLSYISYYVSNYDKIKYYSKKDLLIEDKIDELNSYLQEIFICSLEDYNFWKQSIEEVVTKIKYLIPDTYEYEIEKAKNYKSL